MSTRHYVVTEGEDSQSYEGLATLLEVLNLSDDSIETVARFNVGDHAEFHLCSGIVHIARVEAPPITRDEHAEAIATLARFVVHQMRQLGVHKGNHAEHSETRDALIDRERVTLEDAVLGLL